MTTVSRHRRAWRWIGIAVIVFCALRLFGCAVVNVFYHPSQTNHGHPGQEGLTFEAVLFASRDGTKLSGWFLPAVDVPDPRHARGTVVHVHGNAENISAHWFLVSWLPARGYNVFLFDYRGFGDSEGKPEPKGVFEDTLSAVEYVRSRSDVDPDKLLLFGQSLGGNNAIAVAAVDGVGIRAVAVEGTFYSYASIANDKLPGVGLFTNDDYSANRHVDKLSSIPLLLIHGKKDNIVPYRHSERLFAIAGEPKKLVIIPDGNHIDAMTRRFGDTYRDVLVAFFDEALAGAEQKAQKRHP